MEEEIIVETNKLGSYAEEQFMEIFTETFGPDYIKYLSVQHPFLDIYQKRRYIDFAIKSSGGNIAIEVDGETYHNPKLVSEDKYIDDLEKQNSLIYEGWKLYKWSYREIKSNRDKVKDEIRLFLGDMEEFKSLNNNLEIIELMDHQEDGIQNLEKLRLEGHSAALLNHATGTGKTVTAVAYAKLLGLKTLFIAHREEILLQAKSSFEKIWPEKQVGMWLGASRENTDIVCASIMSLVGNLDSFKREEFGLIIVDEAHHASAQSYVKVLNYFKPEFLLGLTATIDRSDGQDILDIFGTIGHKLDIRKAIELGKLVPIRCIRVNTNVDIRDIRFNGIKYNFRDLEKKLFLPERNSIILETYLNFVKDKKTLIFCASVKHAQDLAQLFTEHNIRAEFVAGSLDNKERKRILKDYETGRLDILCACDLLNEGWDSPSTEVLFMARPTLSKSLYEQQLGRGLRNYQGKDYLMVFDFVDNANMFNQPYSVHRIFNNKKYIEGGYVVAPSASMVMEESLIYKGEKNQVTLDYPVRAMDYELIDLFDWQLEIGDMVSEMEFVRMVDVQSETIARYIREGKIMPDLQIPMSSRSFSYFKQSSIDKYVKDYGWSYITAKNMKDMFMKYIEKMDMSYSYKPVFISAFLDNMDSLGQVEIENIIDYFIDYYESRRQAGLVVEKKKCLYLRDYTRAEVRRNILSNPLKRFEDMNFISYDKKVGYLKLNKNILKKLSDEDIANINTIAQKKLEEYFKA